MNIRRIMYDQRYKLGNARSRHLDTDYLDQLDACKDEAARRLLLGVSKKMLVSNPTKGKEQRAA